jgi:hypothetical protein
MVFPKHKFVFSQNLCFFGSRMLELSSLQAQPHVAIRTPFGSLPGTINLISGVALPPDTSPVVSIIEYPSGKSLDPPDETHRLILSRWSQPSQGFWDDLFRNEFQ